MSGLPLNNGIGLPPGIDMNIEILIIIPPKMVDLKIMVD